MWQFLGFGKPKKNRKGTGFYTSAMYLSLPRFPP